MHVDVNKYSVASIQFCFGKGIYCPLKAKEDYSLHCLHTRNLQ